MHMVIPPIFLENIITDYSNFAYYILYIIIYIKNNIYIKGSFFTNFKTSITKKIVKK